MSVTNGSLTIAQAEASTATSGLTVSDTAANIAQGLVVQPSLATKVASFNLSANATLSATAAETLGRLGSHLHLGSFRLTVRDSLANLRAAGNAAGVALAATLQVVDTAANLLNAPSSSFARVSSVSLTGTPTLSVAQITYLEALPGFTVDPSAAVTLSDTVSQIDGVLAAHITWFTSIAAITLRMDGGRISAYDAGVLEQMIAHGRQVTFVPGLTDSTLNITATTAHNLAANAAMLSALATHVPLAYSLSGGTAPITAADAAALLTLPNIASIVHTLSVSDTGTQITANAGALFGQGFAGITVTSGAFSGTAAQLLNSSLHFAGISTASLAASANVTAAQAASLAALPGFAIASGASLTVQDSATNLLGMSSHTLGVVSSELLPAGPATVTAAQGSALAAMAHFSNAAGVITVADTIANLKSSTAWQTIATNTVIADAAANITAGANAAMVQNATAVTVTDSAANIATYTSSLTGLHRPLSFTLTLGGVVAAPTLLLLSQAVTLTPAGFSLVLADTLAHVEALTAPQRALANAVSVTDSVADLTSGGFDWLHANVTVPLAIILTDPADTLSFTVATYVADTAQIDAVLNATTLQVVDSAANLATEATVLGADPKVTAVVMTDTAANIDANATSLAAMAGKLSITLTASATVTAATLTLFNTAHSFSAGGYTLTLADNAADVAGLSARALALASSVAITDTAADLTPTVLASLATLTSSYSGTIAITLTGTAPLLSITASTYTTDRALIDDITNVGAVQVTGDSATIAAIATTLTADTRVGSVAVTDTSANVVANLVPLLGLGNALSVTLSDTLAIPASLVPMLVQLGHLTATGITIADTGANIAAVVLSASPATLQFLNAHPVQLSADSNVTVAQAAALGSLHSFSDNSHVLNVWDSASHLASNVYAAAEQGGLISGLYLNTGSDFGSVTMSASAAATLFGLTNFHTGNPDGTPNYVTVADTAANLNAAYSVLSTINTASIGPGLLGPGFPFQLSGSVEFVVTSNATISDLALTHLQTLGAFFSFNNLIIPFQQTTTITVRDTAATIYANAATQSESGGLYEGPTGFLTPVYASAWQLSASAAVSETVAAGLGGLGGFSAGIYKLNLAVPTNLVISIADANDLGNLGSSLVVSGPGQLQVDGTLAQLSQLTSPALAVVTPEVSDTFEDVLSSGLTSTSPLLAGTLTITDSEMTDVAHAESLFGLIKVGNGSGIAPAAISFGSNIETVSGDIADLQTLTGLPAWSQNTGLQASFSLDAADTVANLINPANTSFLASLAGTTLAGNQTATASAAESLFLLEAKIHFAKDDNLLTIADTAANLISQSNADGVGMADTLNLLGADTTSAAGAAILLADHNLVLNAPLTIADTASNLLNNSLATLLAGATFLPGDAPLVELNAVTTIDATTASALVSLPGFTDPSHDLNIADSSGFLIDGANNAAELIAHSVTLAGDETVSAPTILALSEVPNFNLGANHLLLAANDFADAPTLKAIADFGSGYEPNGHTITMTQDLTNLTPAEYNALQSDNVVTNGHILSEVSPTPVFVQATESGGQLIVSVTGPAPTVYNGYSPTGQQIPGVGTNSTSYNATFSDTAPGHSFSLTDTEGGVPESAPLIILDISQLDSAAGTTPFSTTPTANAVQLNNFYLPLYSASTVPTVVSVPSLVYNQQAQTISLDGGSGGVPVLLLTLGGTDHPTSLATSEFAFKTYHA